MKKNHTTQHNLLERIRDHKDAILLFAKNSHVSFTNNRAERDLRMSKVKKKVSGCFRTFQYAKLSVRFRVTSRLCQTKDIIH